MSIQKQNVLVTGGAGFVGSCLVKKLLELGNTVTVVDDLSRGTKENLGNAFSKVKFISQDLRVEQGLIEIFEGHDLVFNLAALNTGVDYDEGRTQKMFEDNMLLQMMPLRAASQTKSIRKFVQISSASVYSREAMEHQVPTPEDADTSNPEPSKLGYALAKKMGENLAKWYAENSPLQTVCARFINVYGENDNFDSMGHFIPVMVRKFVEAEKEVVVFGSGKQKRSFMYVEDAVSALLTLAEKGENGEPYNVDADEEHSVREVVEMINNYVNKPHLKIIFDTTKPEGSQRRLLDSTKLQKLGWKPQVEFAIGLERTVKDIQQKLAK